MYFPQYGEVQRSREITAAFGGYNHRLSCQDGDFYDMKNMTADYYPILSPRKRRGLCRQLAKPQGIMSKENMIWIDDGKLYVDGLEKELDGVALFPEGEKALAKMGAFVVILPDKVWYNTSDGTCGKMEAYFTTEVEGGPSCTGATFSLCDSSGTAITWHDEAYYETHRPQSGDYLMNTLNGKTTLKQWSSATSVWVSVTTTFLQITAAGIGTAFNAGDGIKITTDRRPDWQDAGNIFVNDEGGGRISINTYIMDKTDDSITIAGLLRENKVFESIRLTVKREVPDMEFVTECNNRLWGCSKDGHEIYCCKLGDVTNWKYFAGTSIDAWAATVGSDGKFTGAVTYLGMPVFFKEDLMIKVYVSETGAHRLMETHCRGVQKGSHESLCIVNEILYYKSPDAVCAYGGSQPEAISEAFGDVRYSGASAGTIRDKYYISMKDTEGTYSVFVYDTRKGIWSREDETEVVQYCRHGEDLYFIDAKDGMLKSAYGTLPYEAAEQAAEPVLGWFVESGTIGYMSPDKMYVAKVNIRLAMEYGAEAEFLIQYDSSGSWKPLLSVRGTNTRTMLVPVIPQRCDHFKYRLQGRGECKVFSITRTMEEGSDV